VINEALPEQAFVLNLQEVTQRTWQIARTPCERVKAVRFLLTFLAVTLGYRLVRSVPTDLALRVDGLTWYVGVHATARSVLGGWPTLICLRLTPKAPKRPSCVVGWTRCRT
jgi:hypothetical protein